jgi:cell division septation protein DedD
MIKKLSIAFILMGLFVMPLYFSSCCGDEQCSEEDTYGKAIFKKTDTVYKRVPNIKRSPMSVQIGAFVNKNNADYFLREAKERLKKDVYMRTTPEGVYRILIGEYSNIESARETLSLVRGNGYDDAFIRDEFGAVER